MSRDFIGSKISIITKSQSRYSGTIIGIDAQTSSIILGNVKCFGTEHRSGHSTNGHMPGTTLPIMQFANNDIEDLKIVDEEQASEATQQQQKSFSMPAKSSSSSIHDDPAIVSAVISSTDKDNTSISNRLMHNLQHLTLSDQSAKTTTKNEESRIRTDSGELGPSWSLLSPSTWEHNNNNNNSKSSSQQQPSGNKSKFFDDFISEKKNTINEHQFNRSQQRSSNTHSTQTSRETGGQYDEHGLPIRQPFFANDQPYPSKPTNRYQNSHNQYQNGHNQYQNGHNQYQTSHNQYQTSHNQYQQRSFFNNRRPPISNQQRRPGGHAGGNRETFQDNPTNYDADFDFETSNLKFNKLTNENDLPTNQPAIELDSSPEYPSLYDKKKSFFDNLVLTEPNDASTSYMSNRSKMNDTFGNNGYQRYNNYRSNGNGYRRSNQTNYRQQYGNEDFYYRPRHDNNNNNSNNGYHYRY